MRVIVPAPNMPASVAAPDGAAENDGVKPKVSRCCRREAFR